MSNENTSSSSESNSTGQPQTGKKSNLGLIITGVIIVILIVGLVTNGFGLFNKDNNNNPNNAAIPLAIGVSPVLGNDSAKVTIYEFSDFSCPYCEAAEGHNEQIATQLRANDPTWQAPIPLIVQNYVNTGKVKLVFKYTPGHGTGVPSHLVAWCLNDQNLFWQFNDKAFANQADTGDLNKMNTLAQSLGANMTKVQSCLDSQKYNYLLDADTQMGAANGVSGTPTFFINGRIIEGAQSYSAFKKIIDEELAK